MDYRLKVMETVFELWAEKWLANHPDERSILDEKLEEYYEYGLDHMGSYEKCWEFMYEVYSWGHCVE